MRMRRAHQNTMKFAGQRDVGDERAKPAEKFCILDAANRRADPFMRDGWA
jgi:hypothetical protein